MLRREFCRTTLSAVAAASRAPVASGPPWSTEWDRAVLEAALRALEERFDPAERMLRTFVGGEYRYHTTVRNQEVHPTRDSNEYALLLLEAGDEASRDRAVAILDRVLDLQDVDPSSKWYGLWGYFLEEPPHRMNPADWNWADFHGALLVLIEHRHGHRLPERLRERVRLAIGHAAASIRRRNVTMNYTNIAVQGTFVTLAAARILSDADLGSYAVDRLHRFARTVDQTGSFAEYNSPTYTHVTLANLTRMRLVLGEESYFPLIERIHKRAWLHLASHWHAPTRQLAGPMSRCYRTDIGAPIWLQKALNNQLMWARLDQLRRGEIPAPGEVAILPYRCPGELVGYFLHLPAPRQHREVFVQAEPPVRPVQGTTWLAPHFCIGSANRSDFWIQRRPLLAYWRGRSRSRYLQLRLVKDDYDFASGVFYSTQERSYVLGLACFMSPGGDKHPNLDPVRDGAFAARAMRLRWDLSAPPVAAWIQGRRVKTWEGRWPPDSYILLDLGGAKLFLRVPAAAFGNYEPFLELSSEEDLFVISLYWFRLQQPALVRWSDTGKAYAVFTMAMAGPETGMRSLRDLRKANFSADEREGGVLEFHWKTPAGDLGLRGRVVAGPLAELNRSFVDLLNGQPVPLVRLSEERLADDRASRRYFRTLAVLPRIP